MALNGTDPLAPITRYSPEDRVFWFTQNAPAIYNKYSPYTNSSIGPEVPLIYNKLTDTSDERNRIAFDNQELPIVSTIVDVRRMGKMLRTGTGIKFLVNQNYNQGSNAFNETRIYNPLSVVAAAAKTGLSNRFGPTRHMESNGILSYFVSSVLSTVGLQVTQQGTNNPIEGTATGKAYSTYAQTMGGARAGLVRFGTANNAGVRFDTTWGSSTGGGGGFLSNLAKAFIKGMTSNIPSTNPRGAFGKNITEKWEYRPEYKTGAPGTYHIFLKDKNNLLTGKKSKEFTKFYNDTIPNANSTGNDEVKVSQYHRYYPNEGEKDFQTDWYAAPFKVIAENMNSDDINGIGGKYGQASNIRSVYAKYMTTIKSFVDNTPAQSKRSAEAYDTYDKVKIKNPDGKETSYPSYKDIVKARTGDNFSKKVGVENSIEIKNSFAKSSGIKKNSNNGYDRVDEDSHDRYNALDIKDGKRGTEPSDLTSDQQSKDLIYFYFFDLINDKYIPFRATITSLSDQNSADWEDIQYMGRADKLFVYKGFSRDVNFAFTVYANSAKEMIPMWNRINYLAGLTRPSKYTTPMSDSSRSEIRDINNALDAQQQKLEKLEDDYYNMDYYDYNDSIEQTNEIINVLKSEAYNRRATGKESRFIYPPMVTFRIGDMFVDQPAVISSVSITIPDDTNWETLRSDNNETGTKSRQLPLKVDVSVSLKLLEKRQSLGSDAHYGKINGKEHWAL